MLRLRLCQGSRPEEILAGLATVFAQEYLPLRGRRVQRRDAGQKNRAPGWNAEEPGGS